MNELPTVKINSFFMKSLKGKLPLIELIYQNEFIIMFITYILLKTLKKRKNKFGFKIRTKISQKEFSGWAHYPTPKKRQW